MGYRIVIPCCFPEDHALWKTDEWKNVVAKSFRMAGCFGVPVHVVSTEQDYVDTAQDLGLEGHLLTTCPVSHGEYPSGAGEAVDLVRTLPGAKEDALVVLDVRNPLLGQETILSAIDEYNKYQPSVLVSVGSVRDHPCQFNRYMQLEDVLLYFMTDLVDDQTGERAGRFFPMDWQYGEVEQDGLYGRISTLFDHRFTAATDQQIVWEKRGDLARVLSRECSGGAVVTWGAENNAAAPAITDCHEGLKVCWTPESGVDGSYSMWLVPFLKNGLQYGQAQVFSSKKRACEMFLDMPSAEVVGWVGVLSREVHGGHYDYVEPLEFPSASWKVVANHRRVNLKNDKVIFGRQDFPEVFELDMSITIISADVELRKIEEYPRVETFMLPDEKRIRLETPLDMLRLRAKELSHEKD